MTADPTCSDEMREMVENTMEAAYDVGFAHASGDDSTTDEALRESRFAALLSAIEKLERVDERKVYEITLAGCDDSTTISIPLTTAELELVEQIAGLTRGASSYGCMPKMFVEAPSNG